jgi:hypothetical protein
MVHHDGDEEDLEADEVKAAFRAYESGVTATAVQPKAGASAVAGKRLLRAICKEAAVGEKGGGEDTQEAAARVFLPPSTVAYLKQWMMSPQVRVLLASCFLVSCFARTRCVFFLSSLSV